MANLDNSAWASDVERRIGQLLRASPVVLERPTLHGRPDMVVRAGNELFVIEFKRSGSIASVAAAIRQLHGHTAAMPECQPMLVVPHMSTAAADLAEDAGISWLDLSGNALIRTNSSFVNFQGFPNRFKERGRPASPFAPKSSRIVRWFLANPGTRWTQKQLADATGVERGQVSRVVRRLNAEGLLTARDGGALYPINPTLLLDAWREDYEFGGHDLRAGHVPGRSGQDVARRVSQRLQDSGVEHAATGLAGAWLLDQFASFRLATFFTSGRLTDTILDDVDFREDPRGANVWIVTPNDPWVLRGAELVDGIMCAHLLQVYLDLPAHPERAAEAAEHLRPRVLRSLATDG